MPVVVGVLTETSAKETRVAIVPEIAAKLKAAGVRVLIERGAGAAAHFPDALYADAEFSDAAAILGSADVLLKVQPPNLAEVNALKKGAVVIGFMQAYARPDLVRALKDRGVTSFAMELVPRISRAQSMDALSSQASVAGYKAVLIAANTLDRFLPMLTTAAGVEWTVVGTEVEALQLEYSWIKEFDPRFNIKYRDDKSYPYLAVTIGDEYPRVMVMRGAKRKGTRYFGPYSHAWAIRDTVDTLLRVFPVRTCSAGVFKRSGQIGRPCLLGYIGKCSAPCVKRISAEEHRALAEDFCDFMAGQTSRFAGRLEAEMRQAAREEEFERAARLRDDLRALERAIEKQAVVLGDGTDCDVIALAEDQLEAAVQVFYVRGGRVRGQRGWVLDKIEEVTPAGLVEQFLGQVYADSPAGTEAVNAGIPREVLVPELPPDPATMTQWLAERRGGPVSLRVPRRGDKRALLETVARNAGQSLALHKTRRASDLTTRSKALSEIQEALELDDAPLRIECYDVSNLQGTHVVASMVVFEDGLARKSEYRRFAIKGTGGTDDISSIYEVITRRFRRYLAEREKTGELDTLGDPDPQDPAEDHRERAEQEDEQAPVLFVESEPDPLPAS